ncbi:glycosyltransferase [Terrimonas sp. NA20]|uniref:Glycosyltransferase n=1 Tax=Terrimonas ginsenosidimutans TaxID=2908004 RepID=A0ABS9KNT5_9BACT|nr:glycosyltransferase [Terrimonas ginsenosidimutans]MCG2613978.1 glycosyltransferase [Terrimonas ginsenosidimutans]
MRKKVAILYSYNENWIGSTYYIQNLISALNTLKDDQKPEVLIVTTNKEAFDQLALVTKYAYLRYRKLTLAERIINNFTPAFIWKNIIGKTIFRVYTGIDLVFPATAGVSFSFCKNRLFWIADFQEHYLPGFFSREEIDKRKNIQKQIVEIGREIVFSSHSAKDNFNEIYPSNGLNQYVLPFAVTNTGFPEGNDDVLNRYGVAKNYFLCSNQFWKHKNHEMVLRAVASLKAKGQVVQVVFTGKERDYRNPTYIDDLKALAKTLAIEKEVLFLGFISRADQLQLMKRSVAVIQPSLFEGWSTVIEDAKSLNVKIIASDLEVHREQLQTYPWYRLFNAANEDQLCGSIADAQSANVLIAYDYREDIAAYGNAFLKTLNTIVTKKA